MTGGRARARLAASVLVVPVLAGCLPSPPAVAQEQPGRQPDIACAVPEPAAAPAGPPPGLAPAHRIATGAGVRVAVVDTGVADHPQLGGVVPGGDLVSPQAPEPLLDCDGHGTVVAGVIAARDSGIAPDATVISVRQSSAHYRQPATGETNQGGAATGATATTGTLAGLAEAVHLALDAGAQVINVSVVSCVPADVAARLDTGPLDEALYRAEADGAVVVAAAGNQSRTCGPGAVVYPAHAPTVLSVAALDRDAPHALAGYSMPAGTTGSGLAAPGAVPTGLSPDGNGWAAGMRGADRGEVVPFAGTSFAAPVVSGTVALLRERHPQESAAQLRERVRGAAEPGHGVVDPYSALTHLAADFTVAARDKEVTATPAPDERARRAALLVMGGLGLLVLAGVVVAGLLPRRVTARRLRTHRRR
ncbi:S8 family serine peptidase [Corynebacterium halotolerans]|uniref:Serine protease n=1 Tax=Corynebacterium halotolerans YIM 70093 = DSM 44683 TaxID=1121362 RepID=M1P4K3_9CORY|nr:S8 family serine peptidase [Corynebacterium halotolerans]AGF71566.1 serine protease [Corynebacterium halotolerans YIM 70093 = DSM 44683]